MPFNDIGTESRQNFLDLYKENPSRLAIFVGAGLSMPLFPSWGKLLEEMVLSCHSRGKLCRSKKELKTLLDNIKKGENYLDIASACVNELGTTDYRSLIEKYFDKNFSVTDVPKAYRKLFELPIDVIVTTNYDLIPEKAGSDFRIYSNHQVSEATRAIEQGKKVVVKIHGDVTHQESIVLTNKDFAKIIHKREDVKQLLKTIFSTKTVLFLGFSLSDPHINLILQNLYTINSDMPVTHYALIAETNRFKINSLETNYGMRVISYTPSDNSHPEVMEFIESLSFDQPDNPPVVGIESVEEMTNFVSERLRDLTGNTPFVISFNEQGSNLDISLISISSTPIEFQQEILSIISTICNFNTSNLQNITINFQGRTQAASAAMWSSFCPMICTCKFTFESAYKFIKGSINTRQFWSTLSFFYVLNSEGPEITELIAINIEFIGSVR